MHWTFTLWMIAYFPSMIGVWVTLMVPWQRARDPMVAKLAFWVTILCVSQMFTATGLNIILR